MTNQRLSTKCQRKNQDQLDEGVTAMRTSQNDGCWSPRRSQRKLGMHLICTSAGFCRLTTPFLLVKVFPRRIVRQEIMHIFQSRSRSSREHSTMWDAPWTCLAATLQAVPSSHAAQRLAVRCLYSGEMVLSRVIADASDQCFSRETTTAQGHWRRQAADVLSSNKFHCEIGNHSAKCYSAPNKPTQKTKCFNRRTFWWVNSKSLDDLFHKEKWTFRNLYVPRKRVFWQCEDILCPKQPPWDPVWDVSLLPLYKSLR